MHKIEDLNDLRLVALVAETGSLSGAARVLGVNHATVFRRLGQLQERLAVRLFERSGGRYHTTTAGEALAKAGAQLQATASEALLHVAGQDLRPSGEVRITSTDSLALGPLPQALAACQARYPDIRLTVEIDNRSFNLSRRDADIALRPTTAPPDYLIGKRIAPLPFAVYGSRDYLERAGDRAFPAHTWIALDESYTGHRTLRWLAQHLPLTDVAYRTSSFGCIHQACRAGLGLAVLPCFIGDGSADLQRLGDSLPDCAAELWLLTHPDLRETTRVKVVFQLLQAELSAMMGLAAADRGQRGWAG